VGGFAFGFPAIDGKPLLAAFLYVVDFQAFKIAQKNIFTFFENKLG
jgi:hypothetical protein